MLSERRGFRFIRKPDKTEAIRGKNGKLMTGNNLDGIRSSGLYGSRDGYRYYAETR